MVAAQLPEIVSLKLSAEELESSVASSKTIQEALAALYRDGIVVLSNAVDTDHIDVLNKRLMSDLPKLMKRSDLRYNQGAVTGNVAQIPPLVPEFMFKDIFANPIAATILHHFIGPEPKVLNLTSNIAIKAAESQQIHADVSMDHPNFPYGAVVNVNLVDTRPENGSTEFWLGTPNISLPRPDPDGNLRSNCLENRKEVSPPFQPSLPKGSLIIRDIRIWHAGRPNFTDEPRAMIGLAWFAKWYESPIRMAFPESIKKIIESWKNEVAFVVDYVSGEMDYLAYKTVNPQWG